MQVGARFGAIFVRRVEPDRRQKVLKDTTVSKISSNIRDWTLRGLGVALLVPGVCILALGVVLLILLCVPVIAAGAWIYVQGISRCDTVIEYPKTCPKCDCPADISTRIHDRKEAPALKCGFCGSVFPVPKHK